ncbi:hypothetical protein GYMLUDRAFT_97171 [Collybiopsis luxurians FD-317 M1]|uniref:Unplaced genomic scaffold GYMLUscaffold_27, whole genome shotgun sequence n=1 Tax=Collybiopsis luxurians FD-317 M1 TaxID=944289 RepID=A0A0D0CD62_9AGAR|nr:hypothetical protein GYMLUDRAFT_97171 [Collybiopsis luxurians FD-317 M1]
MLLFNSNFQRPSYVQEPFLMASTSQVQARYDSTSTHLLSEKAIVEGWDTFIFYAELIQPGALIIGECIIHS